MKVKINDDFGISSDKRQYHLCKIKEEKEVDEDTGEVKKVVKFQPFIHTYQTIGDVLEAYVQYRMRTKEGLDSFKKVVDFQEKTLDEIRDIKEELGVEINEKEK